MKFSLITALLSGMAMAAPAIEAALPPGQQRDVEANKANLYTHAINEYDSFSEVEKRQLDDFADILLLARLTERDGMHKRQVGDLLGNVVQGVVGGAVKGLQGHQLKARNPTDAVGVATGAVGGLTGGLAGNKGLHERQLDILTGLLGSLLGGLGSQPPPPTPDVADDTVGNKTETTADSTGAETPKEGETDTKLEKRQLDILTGLLGSLLGGLGSQPPPPTPDVADDTAGNKTQTADAATGSAADAKLSRDFSMG